MTPRDFRVMATAKSEMIRQDQMFQDKLQAFQIAQLMFVQGRIAKKPIDPVTCMTFVWDKPSTTTRKMTEEDMTRFDQNMDVWGGVRPHG